MIRVSYLINLLPFYIYIYIYIFVCNSLDISKTTLVNCFLFGIYSKYVNHFTLCGRLHFVLLFLWSFCISSWVLLHCLVRWCWFLCSHYRLRDTLFKCSSFSISSTLWCLFVLVLCLELSLSCKANSVGFPSGSWHPLYR